MKWLRSALVTTLGSALFVIACKKQDSGSSSGSQQVDSCVIGHGVNDGAIITGRYIVAFNTSIVSTTRMSAEDIGTASWRILQSNAVRKEALVNTFGGELGGFVANLSEDEALRVKNDPSIRIVEPDRVVALGACFTVVEPTLITWSVKRVGYGDGTGKTAWIIDSGIDFTHPDLNVDQARSKSFLTGQTSAADENGHGTHVAGIIGAKNNTIGLLGVASGANLVSLRVLDANGQGTVSGIIQALAYVSANGSAGDVVNMSVGEESTSAILDAQVQNTAAKGIFIAIAAGNDGKAARDYSPGRVNGSNIFTVSAIDSLDNFASFSNYGNDVVDYAAPGVRVLSTYMGGRYAIMSGTSMATPHVAGLLLLKGRNISTSGYAQNDPDGSPDPIAHY
jgi:hypothetical protein